MDRRLESTDDGSPGAKYLYGVTVRGHGRESSASGCRRPRRLSQRDPVVHLRRHELRGLRRADMQRLVLEGDCRSVEHRVGGHPHLRLRPGRGSFADLWRMGSGGFFPIPEHDGDLSLSVIPRFPDQAQRRRHHGLLGELGRLQYRRADRDGRALRRPGEIQRRGDLL